MFHLENKPFSLASFVSLLFSLATSACGGGAGEASFAFDNNVFSRTSRLNAATSGDARMPSVSWPSTGRRLVVAGFFTKRLDVRQNVITNQNDVFWIWHSGLTTGREGNVTWSDGVVARFGQPIETERPPPLAPGTYYWAVWALDDQGKPALSTIELTHVVP